VNGKVDGRNRIARYDLPDPTAQSDLTIQLAACRRRYELECI
jgi:hypothetical protein